MNTTIETLKKSAALSVESRKKQLVDMSLSIHANPEILFKEFRSSKLLSDYLADNGFKVEYPFCGLQTAFQATIGEGFPRIGIMAEYDALPDIGHGCGHNIIGTAAVGAGVALASIIKELGGQVVVFGTPGEEGGNGKEIMAKQGAFKDIDAAMMIHPFNFDMLYYECGTVMRIVVEYFGKAAHPSTPEKGINALDAMLVGYGAFNNLRQQCLITDNPDEGVTGAILQGGVGAHIIPDHTVAEIIGLAANEEKLRNLLDKLHSCFNAGASATGARLEFKYEWEQRYRGVYSNRAMCKLFDDNMKSMRPNWNPTTPASLMKRAATDMGTVSQIVPSIHPFIAILPSDAGWHSIESVSASASEEGNAVMLESAKAMAMTAIDLIKRPEVLESACREFSMLPKHTLQHNPNGQ